MFSSIPDGGRHSSSGRQMAGSDSGGRAQVCTDVSWAARGGPSYVPQYILSTQHRVSSTRDLAESRILRPFSTGLCQFYTQTGTSINVESCGYIISFSFNFAHGMFMLFEEWERTKTNNMTSPCFKAIIRMPFLFPIASPIFRTKTW